MTFINIIYKLPDAIKNIYRNIERNQNNITKNIWSIKFYEIYVKIILILYSNKAVGF